MYVGLLKCRVNLGVVRTSRSMHLDMGRRIGIGDCNPRIRGRTHVWGWGIWVTLRWSRWWLRESRRSLGSELEGSGHARIFGIINMDALSSTEFVDIVEIETLNVTLK